VTLTATIQTVPLTRKTSRETPNRAGPNVDKIPAEVALRAVRAVMNSAAKRIVHLRRAGQLNGSCGVSGQHEAQRRYAGTVDVIRIEYNVCQAHIKEGADTDDDEQPLTLRSPDNQSITTTSLFFSPP
jgi:hypothetical protein